MPNTREKLIAWLCEAMIIFDKKKDEPNINPFEVFADHLIANGVVLDKDYSKISSKWISVKDRLPTEEDAIEGGFVLANTEEKVIIALWSDVCRFNEFVTHWMPLPEPPKGE